MVELGNELYLTGTSRGSHHMDYVERFPTAADYAKQMNAWIAAIHSAFPDAKVAAVATDANDVRGINRRRLNWNADVLPALKGADAVTVHENLRVFDTTAPPSSVLSFPYLHFQRLKSKELALFASYHLPTWITEFNLADMTSHKVFRGTWLHGLFVAEEALLFAQDPEIDYIGLNATMGNADSAAIFNGAHGFGASGPATVPLALTAAGTTLSLIQSAFHRASASRPLSFSPRAQLASTGAPALIGEELRTASGDELLVVNLSDHSEKLKVSGVLGGSYSAKELTASSVSTKVTGPSSVERSTSLGSGTVEVKPYSLAEITS
jgi:hypothetical protein